MNDEYPKEFFVPIEGEEYREARLTLTKLDNSFSVEIDIVQIETKKIWHHVDMMHGFSSDALEDEVVDLGVQRLSKFLSGQG